MSIRTGSSFIPRNVGDVFRSQIPGTTNNNIIGLITNPGGFLLGAGLNALIPKPVVPPTIAAGSQVYNVNSRQNLARLGGSQPVLYGRFRIYPDLLSQPWAEYVDKEQFFHQLMVITQGEAELEQLFIGDTPIESFAAVEYQIYQPGELVDLFHNNVFTNAQVQDLELVTVGEIAEAYLTFRQSPHSIESTTPIFEKYKAGDMFRVGNSLYNDGDYLVGSVSGDFKTIVVTGTVNDEDYVQTGTTTSTITRQGSPDVIYGPDQFQFVEFPYPVTHVIESLGAANFSTLVAGDTITVSGSVLNDGDYLVTSVFSSTVIHVDRPVRNESPTTPPDRLFQVQLIARDVGPFYANPARTNISEFSVDITFTGGLYNVGDSGELTDRAATLRIEFRQEGDADYTLAEEAEFIANKNTPQRYTKTYSVGGSPFTGRIEVKVTRTSPTAADDKSQDESHWTGLRGFLKAPTSVTPGDDKPDFITDAHWQYPDRTVLAFRVRATGQLAGAMGQQINGIFQRLLRTWDGSAWSAPVATSSIAWAMADAITNDQYGLGRADDELDLDTLLAFDTAATARGDFFNGYFDQALPQWDALNSIARVGRAVPTYDSVVFSIVRDEQRTLRAGLFTDQNTLKGSLGITFDLVGEETPQGVRVSYHDPDTFQEKTILCGDDVNTTEVTLFGCTDRDQAWREGNFILNGIKYRRINVSFGTEKDGFVPGFMDLAELQAAFPNWGQSARVIEAAGNVLTFDQTPDWSAPPYTVRLRDADGTPTDALPGTGSGNTFTLDDAPPITPYAGSDRERTHVAIGNSVAAPLDILIKSLAASDENHVNVTALVDDPRVYADPGPAPAEDS